MITPVAAGNKKGKTANQGGRELSEPSPGSLRDKWHQRTSCRAQVQDAHPKEQLPSPELPEHPSDIPAAPRKNEQHQTDVGLMKAVRAVPRENCHICRWEKQAPGSFSGSQGLGDLELSKERMGSCGCLQLTALRGSRAEHRTCQQCHFQLHQPSGHCHSSRHSASPARGHRGTRESSALEQGG